MEDPKHYPGCPLVYHFYRHTPLGAELTAVLDEFRSLDMIKDSQQDMIFTEFDREMTRHLGEVQSGHINISRSRGNLVDMKKIDLSYQITLKPAVVQLDSGTHTLESLEILAVRGNLKPKSQ